MNRKLRFSILCLMLLAFACTANMTMKPWSEQTPQDRLTWMLGIYNAQDRDYRAMAAMPNLTQAQKSVLQKKKAIMVQVYPLIDAYRLTVSQGGTPSQTTEQAILNLLNQLTTVGG
jgi:hypothetical protein